MNALILGAGISGLAAAWFIHKRNPEAKISLLEQQKRLGGWIDTRKEGDFLFEMGPRTFEISRCTELLQLIADLGLERELIYSDPSAKARYIFHRGKLKSIQSFWPQLLRAALQDLLVPKGSLQEESIYQFATRRFGKTAAELFFDLLAKGIFAGDIQKLSLDACFGFFRKWEQKHRSIVKAMLLEKKKQPGLFTLRGGMVRLIDELAKLPIEIHTGCKVESIRPDGVIAGGKVWDAQLIICALPGHQATKLCDYNLSLSNQSLSVAVMGYCGNVLPKKGYGYLVPSIEKEELLGQIWDSSIFPVSGQSPEQTRVTSMIQSQKVEAAAIDAMWRHLGIAHDPQAILVKEALIPQYEVGHLDRMAAFEATLKKSHPKLLFAGNYFEGASVEACIRRAKRLVLNANVNR